MKRRFRALTGVIQEAVVQQDVFGLRESVLVNAELRPPGYRAFDFPRLTYKVDAFMQWLKLQEEKGILELGTFTRLGGAIEDAWVNVFILDSYKRGVIRARTELKKAGYRVPTVAESGGIEAIMSSPFHVDAAGYVFTRAFEQLKGITAAMDMQISQVLAQGLLDGDGPPFLSRKLIATINGNGAGELGITDTLGRFIPAQRRADMLARTEIIRAHHTANIQEYMNWRAMGAVVMAEWSTSGGNRVCPICADLEGRRFELEEIQNMIPRHPMCRCVAVPMEVDPETQEPIIY
jgi:SPP1 gp7 family putative phage head morphogenesis protein